MWLLEDLLPPDSELITLLCRLFYLGAVLAVVATASFPRTRALLVHYGKLLSNNSAEAETSRGFLDSLLNFRVPKRWFWQFYAFGLAWFGCWTWELALFHNGKDPPLLRFLLQNDLKRLHSDVGLSNDSGQRQSAAAALLTSGLLTIQMARRLAESFYVTKPSDALMHAGHYLVGFVFYGFTGIAAWIESSIALVRCLDRQEGATCTWSNFTDLLQSKQVTFGIGLFVYASIQQFRAHRVLGSLRTTPQSADSKITYSLPSDGPFQTLDSPHYFFEILIYASLIFVNGGRVRTLWYCLLWVVVNLGVTAGETSAWYRTKYGDEHKKMRRWRMVPFLW
jgi:3-oxo-5-alpha-steroid 4-dehydrogenase 3